MNKHIIASAILLNLTATTGLVGCAGITVQRSEPLPPSQSKPGITLGSGGIGKFEIQKGFWCEVRGKGLITVGQSGPTEAKATELAQEKCRSLFKDSGCELVSCKPN